ncbi:PilZ domain-containing protein [Thermodesulfobacteriota bacterium]
MAISDGTRKSQRKGGHREDCTVSADFVVEGRVYMGFIKNKSDSGIFMEAMESLSDGHEITLTINYPGERKPIKRKGKVVRTTSTGFGVEFV